MKPETILAVRNLMDAVKRKDYMATFREEVLAVELAFANESIPINAFELSEPSKVAAKTLEFMD